MGKIDGILPYSARFVGLGGGFIRRKKFSDGLKDAARASPCYASRLYFPFRLIHHVYKEKTRSVALAALRGIFYRRKLAGAGIARYFDPVYRRCRFGLYPQSAGGKAARQRGIARSRIDAGDDVRPAHTVGTAADFDTDAADTVSKPDQPSAAADRLRSKQSIALV